MRLLGGSTSLLLLWSVRSQTPDAPPPADGLDYCCIAFLPDPNATAGSDLSSGQTCTSDSDLCNEGCTDGIGSPAFCQTMNQFCLAIGIGLLVASLERPPVEPCGLSCCAFEAFTDTNSGRSFDQGQEVISCDAAAGMDAGQIADHVLHTNSCPARKSGSGQGDPHFQTFSNRWYDFHGVCDLVLLSVPDFAAGSGLDIHIRTRGRYEYSYIEAAAIKIGNDILEVASFGEHWLNGVEAAMITTPGFVDEHHGDNKAALGINNFLSLGGYPIGYTQLEEKKHSFVITLDESSSESIVVTTFKDLVAVNVLNATSTNFASSVGMMGKFADGALVGRDGMTVMEEDLNAFGQEWQVLPSEPQLFQTTGVSRSEGCTVPVATNVHRRLGSSLPNMEDAEKACAHLEAEMKDMCIFDVIAMGSLEVAGAY